MSRPQVVLATNNPGKVEELRRILGGDVELLGLRDVAPYEPGPETGATFEENALAKALEAGQERREDALQLLDLGRVARRDHHLEAAAARVDARRAEARLDGAHASASRCSSVSRAVPASARSSSASSSERSKGAPSAVPCTSTSSPRPVATTFMSVPARTSSR